MVLAQCVWFFWPSMLYAFLILAPTDGFCLADKKGSMLDLGQFPKVSQVYIVLHQQVPLRV